MTPIADMVERMFEADSSVEIILLAIRTAESVRGMSADKSADTRRQRDRDRKRLARETRNSQAISTPAKANDVAGMIAETSADKSADGAENHCDLTSLLPSLKGLTEEGSKAVRVRARGTRLAPETPLSDIDRAAAIELGASADRLDGMWAEFLDYWISVPGQRGTKLNWSATWRNRVRDVLSRGNRNVQTVNSGGAYGASKDRFREAFEDLKAYNRRSDEGDGTIVEFLPAVGRERA